ncbi:hypothetical protein [Candidatus Harpocratesius sp.]
MKDEILFIYIDGSISEAREKSEKKNSTNWKQALSGEQIFEITHVFVDHVNFQYKILFLKFYVGILGKCPTKILKKFRIKEVEGILWISSMHEYSRATKYYYFYNSIFSKNYFRILSPLIFEYKIFSCIIQKF